MAVGNFCKELSGLQSRCRAPPTHTASAASCFRALRRHTLLHSTACSRKSGSGACTEPQEQVCKGVPLRHTVHLTLLVSLSGTIYLAPGKHEQHPGFPRAWHPLKPGARKRSSHHTSHLSMLGPSREYREKLKNPASHRKAFQKHTPACKQTQEAEHMKRGVGPSSSHL